MKALTYFLLVSAVALSSAFADGSGNPLPPKRAAMNMSEATGEFIGYASGTMEMNYEEESADLVNLTLTLDRGNGTAPRVWVLPIQSHEKTGCGDAIVAYPLHQSNFRYRLKLTDYSAPMRCMMREPEFKWQATFSMSSPRGNSEVKLLGNP